MSIHNNYNEVEQFVTDGKFVNPEKLMAVDIYGLEKAKEMWKNGEPNFTTRKNLLTLASIKALHGIL